MTDFILNHYNWVKALHVIAVMAWMAGLLYLPRLFVYHAGAAAGSELSETLKIMERRLLRYIMNPAMIAAWIFGGLMLWANWGGLMAQGWMHAKLTAVILMTIVHHLYARWRKEFAADANTRPAKFYKIWNEVPTALMILIVIFAVAEPF